jgi:TnpA family transposase
MRTL